MTGVTQQLTVRVTEVQALTSAIKMFRLETTDGSALPAFTAGAHISVRIPPAPDHGNVELWRSYSLVDADTAISQDRPRNFYEIAVRREENSSGGSRHLHEKVAVGDALTIRPPVNDFPLTIADDVVLVAGGIGVTPMIAMATDLLRAGKRFQLHYSCRSADQAAYLARLRALAGNALHLHFDDQPDCALSIDALLKPLPRTTPIYVCGPQGMIDAVLSTGRALGWQDTDLHSESFAGAAPRADDQPFEVALRYSGQVLQVPADKTLLDVLVEAGVFVPYDCRNGYCGLCSVTVSDGEIDHRDSYLLDADRECGKVMQPCVSRARSGRLVLDL